MKLPLFTVCVAFTLLAFTRPASAQRDKPPIRPDNDPISVAYRQLGASEAVLVDEPRIGRLLFSTRDKHLGKGWPTFHFGTNHAIWKRGRFIDHKVPFALSFVAMTDELVKDLVQHPDLANLKNLAVLGIYGEKLTAAAFKDLATLKNVPALWVQSWQVTPDQLKELAGMKNLTTIYLSEFIPNDDHLMELRKAGMLHLLSRARGKDGSRPKSADEIDSFDLGNKNVHATDAGLKAFASLPNLTTLRFSENRKVTEAGLRDLTGLKNLTTLELSFFITDTTLRNLREVDLLHAILRATTQSGKRPKSAMEVHTLDLERMKVTDAGLKELATLKNLATLNLKQTSITDAGLKELAPLRKLTSLTLPFSVSENVVVTLHDIDLLHALPRATAREGERPQSALEVHALDLEGLDVTDMGLKALAGLKNLQTLLLRNTTITEAGLKELAPFKKLNRLSLSIPVSDAALRTMQEIDLLHALPQATAREGKRPQSALDVIDLDLSDLKVTDAGAQALAGLTNLARLDLRGTSVTDAGLKHLAGMKNLTVLDLDRTKVTDAGLKELAGFKKLATLTLPAISDATIRTLRDLDLLHALIRADAKGGERPKSLQAIYALYLHKTQLTDAGIKALAGMTNLVELDLSGNQLTDAALNDLGGFPKLTKLKLSGNTRITDAGLKALAGLKSLTELHLSGTDLTDAGLKHLASLSKLRRLDIGATKVTATGLKELAAFPRLTQLDTEGTKLTPTDLATFRRTIDNRAYTKQSAIRTYLHAGGTYGGWSRDKNGLHIFTPGPKVDEDALPGFRFQRDPVGRSLPDLGEPFALSFENIKLSLNALRTLSQLKSLVQLDLNGTGFTDAGLKQLSRLEKLSVLLLGGAKVSDQGLKELAGLVNLIELDLSLTQITDAGLKSLSALKGLARLELASTALTDAGLKEVAQFKNLAYLDLSGTKLTDAGLKDLAALQGLASLYLDDTPVTDVGLKELAHLKNLTRLHLDKTQVTEAGLAELRKGLPNCKIMR